MSYFITEIPIFHGHIVFTTSQENFNKACVEFGGDEEDLGNSSGATRTWSLAHPVDGRNVYIIGVFNQKLTTLAHEITHLIFNIHRDCGIEIITGGANETFAYLTGWVMEQLYPNLNK